MKIYNRLSILVLLLASICLTKVFGQSQDQNYIKTVELLEPVDINTLNASYSSIKKTEVVNYLDGFGKVKQVVSIKASPLQNDIVQHIEYDQFGRIVKKYLALPTAQSTGNYVPDAGSQIQTYYQNNFNDQHPYGEVVFENSPINRIVETAAPGDVWQIMPGVNNGYTSKIVHEVNVANEVLRFDITSSGSFQTSFYGANELVKTVTKNENWVVSDGKLNTNEAFADKSGRKIAEFSYELDGANIKQLATYYVYDIIGNLKYVIPPKAIDQIFLEGLFTPFSLNYSWVNFVENSASVANGSGNVIISLNNIINPGESYGKLSMLFNMSMPLVFPFGGGAILKQGNIVGLPANSNLGNKYLFSIYPPGRGGEFEIPSPGNIEMTGGDPTKSRYEYSVKDGYIFCEFIVGTNIGSQTTPFKLFSVSNTYDTNFSMLDSQVMDNLCYQYVYDEYNRQIEQKTPGKGWEYVIYDLKDRPILSQDANLKAQNKWLFTKYDVHGRKLYSGLYTSNLSRSLLQQQAFNFINLSGTNKANIEERSSSVLIIGGIGLNYTNNAFPNTNLEVQTVNFYDDYNFTDVDLPMLPSTIQGQTITTRTKGLLTATWVKTLELTSAWVKEYMYYDEKGRIVYLHKKNHLSGYSNTENKLDFRGKVEKVITSHKRSALSSNTVIEDRFQYDHVERLQKHTQIINSQEEQLIAKNDYNELGQLIRKGVGGKAINVAPLQNVDYKYNIRGWLTEVNDVDNLGSDVFSYKMNYQAGEGANYSTASKPQYNGNISQVIWKSSYDNVKKSYFYKYDDLNRLSLASYGEGTNLNTNWNKYQTSVTGYDSNGNILGVVRKGVASTSTVAEIDNLVYTYDEGNKLISIADTADVFGFKDGNSGTDYLYDNNGNLIQDNNKDIQSIQYNHFDLVSRVDFANGDNIVFGYDANGVKLNMVTTLSGVVTKTEYLDGFQYINETMKFVSNAEGYAQKNGANFDYIYTFKDHLGNVRVSIKDEFGTFEGIEESTFTGSTDNWLYYGVNGIVSENNRLKITATNFYEGAYKDFTGISGAGQTIDIYADVDKGNQYDVGVVVFELDASGNQTAISSLGMANNGLFTATYTTVAANTTQVRLKFQKPYDVTQFIAPTTFYVDNVRLTSGNIVVLAENNYYPMGLNHAGAYVSASASDYNYKFQGKEELTAGGYNMYDFGSRMYDPAVGRWFNTDPQNQFASPYVAMGNNHIMMVDPNGEFSWLVGALVGGIVNTAIDWARGNINSWGDAGLSFLGGAGSSAASGHKSIGNVISTTAFNQYSSIATGETGISFGFVRNISLHLVKNPSHIIFADKIAAEYASKKLEGTTVGDVLNFGIGFRNGAEVGAIGTVKFVGGLFTGESWVAMYDGLDFMYKSSHLGGGAALNYASDEGYRMQMDGMLQAVDQFVGRWQNGGARGKGYVSGYVTEKILEAIIVKRVGANLLNGKYKTRVPYDPHLHVNGFKIPRQIGYKKLTKMLRKHGFEFVRNGKGDHKIWGHPDSKRSMTIPDHKQISIGVRKNIQRWIDEIFGE